MSTTTEYKNTSEADQTLVGFGVVKAGETVTTSGKINHPAFQQVEPEPEAVTPKRKEAKTNE